MVVLAQDLEEGLGLAPSNQRGGGPGGGGRGGAGPAGNEY